MFINYYILIKIYFIENTYSMKHLLIISIGYVKKKNVLNNWTWNWVSMVNKLASETIDFA